jgi:hypothetical protein
MGSRYLQTIIYFSDPSNILNEIEVEIYVNSQS